MKIVITKDHPAFTQFRFVAPVVKTASAELALIKISVDSICSTDGHRLHIAATNGLDLPAGLYEVLKNTKSEVDVLQTSKTDFPDFAPLVGVSSARSRLRLPDYHPTTTYEPYCRIIRAMPTELCLNYKYADEALAFHMTHFSVGGDGPVVLTDGVLSAHIMPAKI